MRRNAPHREDVDGDLDAAALGCELLVEGIVRLPQLALRLGTPHTLVVARPDLTQSCRWKIASPLSKYSGLEDNVIVEGIVCLPQLTLRLGTPQRMVVLHLYFAQL